MILRGQFSKEPSEQSVDDLSILFTIQEVILRVQEDSNFTYPWGSGLCSKGMLENYWIKKLLFRFFRYVLYFTYPWSITPGIPFHHQYLKGIPKFPKHKLLLGGLGETAAFFGGECRCLIE